MNARGAPLVAIAYADDGEDHEAWVRFLVDTLVVDGLPVVRQAWGFSALKMDDVGMVVLVCTSNTRLRLQARLDTGFPDAMTIVPLLRRGAPEDAIPRSLRDRPFLDLRDEAPGSGGLRRLWGLVGGEITIEDLARPDAQRHFAELARAEGPQTAGWSAVAWADEAHAVDDFTGEWPLRRIAAELLREGDVLDEAVVQARRGLMAAIIADAQVAIELHERLVADLERTVD